ncbi:NADPH-dependent FMN reductase [Dickeya fangzhongdai]|uniref:NADPH-dependent FMN reductase n=1 Tax=Dickeya fangzhongdai TaxID=1778540 RepID=UPI000F4E9642|nr:NADPH-dependent FMN reductase [Dickeya fangzhongdai]WPD74109.1 NAD(P)H-dependent oxidoreductase [Dickeya fangzhongdai]
MNILFINGSLRDNSQTDAIIRYFSSLLNNETRQVCWSLRDNPLPFMDPDIYGVEIEKHPNESVRRFVEAIQESEVIFMACPTYHGTVSGVFKNALDHLQKGIFSGKSVIVASTGGGIRSSTQTCDAIRAVVRALGANCLIEHIASGGPDFTQLDGRTELTEPGVQSRCQAALDELRLAY